MRPLTVSDLLRAALPAIGSKTAFDEGLIERIPDHLLAGCGPATRRGFLAGAFAMMVMPTARAGQPIVAYLGIAAEESDRPYLAGLRQGLAELGHKGASQIVLEQRFAGGDIAQYDALIDETAKRGAAVIVVPGIAAALAVHERAPQIPVVAVGLPSTAIFPQLFASLDRPGGNLTGFSPFGEDIAEKRVQLLREISPELQKIGIIHNASDPLWREWGERTETAAGRQGLVAVRLGVVEPSAAELTKMLGSARDNGVGGLIIVRDFLTAMLEKDIARSALALRMTSIGEQRSFVEFGGLMSYGADIPELFRRAASYVDRIVKGEDPAAMPIQLATEFDLVVNAGTAETLSLNLPNSILIRADDVIG